MSGGSIERTGPGKMRFPCRCRIARYDPFDRVGLLDCDGGVEVRFGGSACTDFEPSPGLDCWLIAAVPDPVSQTLRATIVNISGRLEADRLTQIESEVQRREHAARVAAELRARQVAGARANPLHQLERIASTCGLNLPPLYRRWVLEGRTNPESPDYLWLREARWLEPLDIPDRQFADTPLLDGLVPFATTPAGDWWCWWTTHPTGASEYEILLCLHDSEEAEAFAPTFVTWFARVCLTWGTIVDGDSEGAEERQHLMSCADLLEQADWHSLAAHLKRAASQSVFPSQSEVERLMDGICGPRYTRTTLRWQA